MSKWEMAILGDLVETVESLNPVKIANITDYIDISSVDAESKKVVSPQVIQSEQAPSRARQRVRHGDVLVSTVRPNLNAVAVVGTHENEPIASTGFCVLRPKASLFGRYLFAYIQSECFVSGLVNLATGASYPAVSKKTVLSQLVPLPPLEIQQKIANTLDKATALIKKRKTQIEKLDQLIKSRFIEMFGNPAREDIAAEYDAHPLIDLCTAFVGGGTPSMSHPEYYEGGDIPWVKSGDIKSLNISRGVLNITQAGLENSTASMLPTGAVIVVTRSGILKHTLPVAITMNPLAINQDLKGIVANERIVPEYLLWAIKMNERRLLSQVRAVTADNIETGFLKKTPIIVPSLDLQHRFANFVRQTDKSKFELQQGLEKLEKNHKALMYECFQ